ncbi:hypothetical protein ACRQDJ_01755 [Actinotignum sp. GS-2025g]|uniref:hypothetical protein n=1 Tax=Actinotignum TaxID=1653174 RepID=UPI00254A9E2C|nr:hypothetical protein [Actinotignum timonense]MDK6926604.1 hypothetical protein [Actinotignum timonense]
MATARKLTVCWRWPDSTFMARRWPFRPAFFPREPPGPEWLVLSERLMVAWR